MAVNFTWSFNGTNAENIDIPTSDIYTEDTKSTAKYVPNSENVSNASMVVGMVVLCSLPRRTSPDCAADK